MGLFPIEIALPSGFTYAEDFISQEEEDMLIGEIEKLQLRTFVFQGYEARRKVASFGYEYNFETRRLRKGGEIPSVFSGVIGRVAEVTSLSPTSFAELLLTEYPAGAVINWHRDAMPFEVIAGISLLSDCILKLRPYDKSRQSRKAVISVPVRRRSLYIIKGSARWEWEHSTAPVASRRFSITLRTLSEQSKEPD